MLGGWYNSISPRLKQQRGEVMIESMLVLIPVLFVLIFLLCLGFFFYQQWNVQITANETATKVAELYPELEAELKTGVSSYSQVESISKYRYLKLLQAGKYESDNKTRGEKYAQKYLSLVSLAKNKSDPKVRVEVVQDSFANRHIHCEVTGSYRLPFAEGFQIFGFANSYTFSATGDAVCTDFSDYLSSVNFLANVEGICGFSQNKLYKAANSIVGMISKIASAVDKHNANKKS